MQGVAGSPPFRTVDGAILRNEQRILFVRLVAMQWHLRKGMDLFRVQVADGVVVRDQRERHRLAIATTGFQANLGDGALVLQPSVQLLVTAWCVVDLQMLACWVAGNVQRGFGDVDPDEQRHDKGFPVY